MVTLSFTSEKMKKKDKIEILVDGNGVDKTLFKLSKVAWDFWRQQESYQCIKYLDDPDGRDEIIDSLKNNSGYEDDCDFLPERVDRRDSGNVCVYEISSGEEFRIIKNADDDKPIFDTKWGYERIERFADSFSEDSQWAHIMSESGGWDSKELNNRDEWNARDHLDEAGNLYIIDFSHYEEGLFKNFVLEVDEGKFDLFKLTLNSIELTNSDICVFEVFYDGIEIFAEGGDCRYLDSQVNFFQNPFI